MTLSVQGGSDKTEVHLSGYFEPNGEEQDDDMFYGDEDEEAEEDLEESDDDTKPVPKDAVVLAHSLKQAKINSSKNASAKIQPDSDEEEDSDEDVEENESSSDDAPVVP